LNAYLDASVLVTMFTLDSHAARLSVWLASAHGRLSLSDWTLTEFTSALAVARRRGDLDRTECDAAEAALRSWLARQPPPLSVDSTDIRAARGLIKSTEHPLRAGDALHLAVMRRADQAIATFDNAMRRAAADLGLPVEDL
jgi:predicted nucleic acid-binding protein